MNYNQARDIIEKSSWYREIGEHNARANELISLDRSSFERELQTIIDRHAHQQVHVDEIKRLCQHPIKLTT